MKNPRSEERGFLAPPAGLAQEKAASGRFLQAVSATRTGAKRNQRQPELTLLPCGSGVFSCPLDVGIPQAEPKSTRQFRLCRSCLSRMVGAGASTKKGANRKARGKRLGLSVGSPCWARTSDNLINSQVLYRLS